MKLSFARFLLVFLPLFFIPLTSHAGIFGYHEQELSDISSFKKWQGVNQKFHSDNRSGGVAQQLRRMVGVVPSADFAAKLQQVNQRVNRSLRYQEDKTVWGVEDYWASPAETLAKGTGDCDDFAIVKYFSLLDSGVSAQQMRLVILQDQQIGILHAVLAVTHEGRTYILDNRFDHIYTDTTMRYYRPIYALSTTRWWRYS